MPILLPQGLVRFLPAREAPKARWVWLSDGHPYRVIGVNLIGPGTVRINAYREGVEGWRSRRWSKEAKGPRATASIASDGILPMILEDDAATLDDD